ncbi:probable receptor-like protein kinase At2g23200 [Morus notabilis]|uniref:probable receptor-like protein kinase At2g23200 n=1 Tax=Morus notabilis TaxID=981085 RepID=UPI000CED0957|nr:probable receptor-like protein kinase At2g23200 [Morus notabilis]
MRNWSGNSPLVKEFLLTVNKSNEFCIYFIPLGTSFAFVNAIEVFFATNITRDNATLVTHEGKSVSFSGLLSNALHTVHRINVGGQKKYDNLWRNWIPDDDYLYPKGSAKNNRSSSTEIYYDFMEEGNKNIAPEFVYKTCKVLEDNSTRENVTWHFNVSINARYLVRVHFCDILSISVATITDFSLHIDSKFTFKVEPGNLSRSVPFYHDFVVDSESSGFLRIGISTLEESYVKTAFLNGLENMELIEEKNFTPPTLDKPKDNRPIIVGSVCSASGIVFVVAVGLLGFKCKKAKHAETDGFSYMRNASRISSLPNCNLKLKMGLDEILHATRGFDPKLLIGEGGFGKVYEGTLRSGLKVAVKRSDPKHGQGLLEFETEIMILSKIRHRHLVSLIGYCNEGAEMILIYEFMEKGTLRDHIYDESAFTINSSSSSRPRICWSQRLEICIDAATGLHYLHTGPNVGIVHRDVKSTNILLGEHFTAKVADFGLSKSGPLDPDHFSIGIKGSFGYLDPEYLTTLQFTDKSDVYSFGVVLLEVLCGRPAIIKSQKIEEVNLAEWGMYWHKKGQLEKIVDPSLMREISPNSLRKFGETVEKCLSRNGADRPAMIDVLWDLNYALQLQKAEVPRGLPEDSGSGTNAFLELSRVGSLPSRNIIEEGDDLVLIGRSSNFDPS